MNAQAIEHFVLRKQAPSMIREVYGLQISSVLGLSIKLQRETCSSCRLTGREKRMKKPSFATNMESNRSILM